MCSHSGHDDQFALEFGEYLKKFQTDPNDAQNYLLGLYESQKVAPEEAIHTVGYRPVVADGLPEGYSVEATHVVDIPCCKCVQSLCRRNDGSSLALFEHNDKETHEWFGDRPEIHVRCAGKQCCMVETDKQLAATWKRGKRYLTLIGVRDVAEVARMIAWMDDDRRRLKVD